MDDTEYLDPISFKEWDQGPEEEKGIDEIVYMYEHGFAGAYCSEESAEELRGSVEIPYGSDVARIYGFENIGASKLVIPFVPVMQVYPTAWPGPAQTRGSCFKAGSTVLMADGSKKPIEQIEIGDEVISHLGKARRVYELIEKENDENFLLSVKTYNYHKNLVLTSDHLLPVVSSPNSESISWKRAEALQTSDYLLLGKPIVEENAAVLKKQQKSTPTIVPLNNRYGIPVKVKNISKVVHTGKVYCINVEEDHSFILDGFSVHNCVADASVRAALGTLVNESILGLPDEVTGKVEECPKVSPEAEKSGVLSFETIYWFRGHGGDGWDCGSAAKVLSSRCGAVVRKNYPELDVDLTKYSGSLAGKYGRSAPPASIVDHLDNNLFRTATQLQSFEEARDFLAKGFFVLTCGSQGFSSKRDENGVSGRQGSWAHALTLIGADDRPEIVQKYGEPLVLVLNTWGKWNSGPRKILGTDIEIPHGSFWVRWSEFKNRYMAAISGLNGWERKEEIIDWTINI